MRIPSRSHRGRRQGNQAPDGGVDDGLNLAGVTTKRPRQRSTLAGLSILGTKLQIAGGGPEGSPLCLPIVATASKTPRPKGPRTRIAVLVAAKRSLAPG